MKKKRLRALFFLTELPNSLSVGEKGFDFTLRSLHPSLLAEGFSAAAAMERYPDSWSSITYNCQGAVELAGSDITCLNGHAHGS